MRKYPLLLIPILFFACSKNMEVTFKSNNVESLTEDAKILLNGFEVGQVNDISLNKNGTLLIKSELKTDIQFPYDSKFEIDDAGLIGPRIINVKLGSSKKFITEKDTLKLISFHSNFTADSSNVVNKIISKMTSIKDCDSIKIEFTKLKKRIEELENQ